MPGKSHHAKKKHPHQSRKSKAKQRQKAISLQQQVAIEAPVEATAIDTFTPVKAATSLAKIRTVQYPYIVGELRRISILAGIIIIILIILAIVIS